MLKRSACCGGGITFDLDVAVIPALLPKRVVLLEKRIKAQRGGFLAQAAAGFERGPAHPSR